jgi:hypothetical protein
MASYPTLALVSSSMVLIGFLDSLAEGRIFHPPTLLDISTNSSQFGVVFATRIDPGQASQQLGSTIVPSGFAKVEVFSISDLMLNSTASNVRLMTPPAVQWEAILDDKPPRETYKFPYSGRSTQITSTQTIPRDKATAAPPTRLVPVTPRESLAGFAQTFNSTQPRIWQLLREARCHSAWSAYSRRRIRQTRFVPEQQDIVRGLTTSLEMRRIQ